MRLLIASLASFAVACGSADDPSSTATCVPRWRPGAELTIGRESPGAIVLADGDVLAVSGHPDPGPIASADRFDAASGSWAPTGALVQPRNGIGSLQAVAGGRILVAGEHGGDSTSALSGAELYDPDLGTWRSTGSMATGRGLHGVALLGDGRVLVTGGLDWGTELPIASAELYDPASETWSPTSSLSGPRLGHAAVALEDGRVLVVGGRSTPHTDDAEGLLATAELYDPATAEWSPTGSMAAPRGASFTTTRLEDGRVVVTGGVVAADTLTATAEIYDPKTGEFHAAGSMAEARALHTATLLADGRVLIVAGAERDEPYTQHSTAELFDPATETFTAAGSLAVARRNHRALLLPDATVMVIGGFASSGSLASTEIFDPRTALSTCENPPGG